jgi:hypothetical protein
MRWLVYISLCLVLSLAACEAAVQGTLAADNCTKVSCPVGTSPDLESEAASYCGGSVSVERGATSLGGSLSGQCFGDGSCALVCVPPAPCCEGEKWTEDSYECEKTCAAMCACDGKCGVVPGCDGDCGTCGGGEVCSDNVCSAECAEGGVPCGDICAFAADGEVCHLGEVCNVAEYCQGKTCNWEEWDGTPCEDCENLSVLGGDFVDAPGCAAGEVCGGGVCVTDTDCQDDLPACGSGAEADVILKCELQGDSWGWVQSAICASQDDTPYCENTLTGAECVACTDDAHCEGQGEPGDLMACEGNVCVVSCEPDCEGKACGPDGCGGHCGIPESTNGCDADAPYCQAGVCQTLDEACPVPEGQDKICNNAPGDGTLHITGDGQELIHCVVDDVDDTVTVEVLQDCASTSVTVYCSGDGCVACVDDAHCGDDEVCLDNVCVTAVVCPEGESFCNGHLSGAVEATWDAASSAETVLGCTVDEATNTLAFAATGDGECVSGDVCVDKETDGVKTAVCEPEVAPCEGAYLCNEMPDGTAYWSIADHDQVLSCAVDAIANMQVYAVEAHCGGDTEVCLAGACVAKDACPADGAVCNAWSDDNGYGADSLVTCTWDKWTNTHAWSEGTACAATDQLCWDGACADSESCPAEGQYCNSNPETGALWHADSHAEQVMTCASTGGGTGIEQTAGTNCWDDDGKVCIEVTAGAECQVPVACPSAVSVCNWHQAEGVDVTWDDSFGPETVLGCTVDATTNTLVFAPTGDAACTAEDVCVEKFVDEVWTAVCEAVVEDCEAALLCNKKPDGTAYDPDSLADHNKVVSCEVKAVENIQVYGSAGSCDGTTEVCVQSDTGAECVSKNACPGGGEAAVCNQWSDDNGYGAEALVTCTWDEFTNTYAWGVQPLDCADSGQICWDGACADNAACPSDGQYCNTDPDTGSMWDTQANPEQIMTCSTEDGGTVIVQEASGTDCGAVGVDEVCVQGATGAACEVPTAEEPDKCADEGEAVMTSSVDNWNDLVWETTDCPDDTVCVPETATCAAPVSCPVTAGVPICDDDGSYPEAAATVHDVVTCTVDTDTNLLDWSTETCPGVQLCVDGACDDVPPTITSFTVDGVEAGGPAQVIEYVKQITFSVEAEDEAGDVTIEILKDGEPWKGSGSPGANTFSTSFFPMACGTGCFAEFQARVTDESGNVTTSAIGELNLTYLIAGDTVWSVDIVEADHAMLPTKLVDYGDSSAWAILGKSGLSDGLCPWVHFFRTTSADPTEAPSSFWTTAEDEFCSNFSQLTDISIVSGKGQPGAATVVGRSADPDTSNTSWGVMHEHPSGNFWSALDDEWRLTDDPAGPQTPHATGPSEEIPATRPTVSKCSDWTYLVTAGKIGGDQESDNHLLIVKGAGADETDNAYGTLDYSQSAGGYMMIPSDSMCTNFDGQEFLYVSGRRIKESDGTSEPFLSKFSGGGSIAEVWTVPGADAEPNRYFEYVTAHSHDGSVLVSGTDMNGGDWLAFVSKYDVDGQHQWTWSYEGTDSNLQGLTGITSSVQVKNQVSPFIDDGRFVVSGVLMSGLATWVALLRDVGDSAELLWEWTVPEGDGCWSNSRQSVTLGPYGYVDVVHSCQADASSNSFTRFRRLSP